MPKRPGTASVVPDPGVSMIIASIKKELKERGSGGYAGMQRKFKSMDDDGSKTLSLAEFKKAMKEMKIDVNEADLRKVFNLFDADESGSISFEEFIQGVRDPMTKKRQDLVKMAFRILDTDGSGEVDAQEIAAKYDASKHPEVMSKKRTAADVLKEFLANFDVGGVKDGIVTEQEFLNYYANLSASIENENYFELMIRNAWHISGGEGEAANTTNRRVLVTRADGSQAVEEIKNDLGVAADDEDEMLRRLQQQGVNVAKLSRFDGAGAKSGAIPSRPRHSKTLGGYAAKEPRRTFNNTTGSMGGRSSMMRPASAGGYGTRTLGNNRTQQPPKYGTDIPFGTKIERTKRFPLQEKLVVDTLLEVMRAQLLSKGSGGIIDLQRKFMDMDVDDSKYLDYEEFVNAMAANGFPFTDKHCRALFTYFDRDESGSIDYEEFMDGLREELSPSLLDLINSIYDKLDPAGLDAVDPQKILTYYNAKRHPDVVSRRRTPNDVFQEFVDTFDVGGEIVGKVTRAEFVRYYKNIATAMSDEEYLARIISSVWNVPGKGSGRMGTAPIRQRPGTGGGIGARLRQAQYMTKELQPEFDEYDDRY